MESEKRKQQIINEIRAIADELGEGTSPFMRLAMIHSTFEVRELFDSEEAHLEAIRQLLGHWSID